jgi:tRNA threonylcarbamoyl adenosine modification protein (Sua5/YciO/YrdC/YwlC family)
VVTPESAPDRAEAIGAVVDALRLGQVVAIPTDTVYGLAVDPTRPEAVARLVALKERPTRVALPVLVGSWDQVGALCGPLAPTARGLADRYWPGPLTLVVPRSPAFVADLGGEPEAGPTVGIRWPDHRTVQLLCDGLGLLAVTSANRHGRPPVTTAEAVAEEFDGGDPPAVILDGGVCDGEPSTVVECLGGDIRCLREGAIAWSELSGGSSPGGR